MKTPELSIVVPTFNESEMIHEFYDQCSAALLSLQMPYELIFVDDGSRDDTPQKLEALRSKNQSVKIIQFSRNFGHQSAMTAGLEHASGQACVIMDADLQDPPELIGDMVKKWKEGYHVVYAVRRSREGEGFTKKLTATFFYRFMNVLSGINMPLDTGDFRLMDRRVVEVLNNLPEKNRFLRGLVTWVGFKQIGIPFDRPSRKAGETKFPFWKMMRFALDGITAFSRVPLRLVTFIGLGCFMLSMSILLWVSYVKFIAHTDVPGWTSLIGIVVFLGSIQLLSLGVMGEYIARMFDEIKQRPAYLIEKKTGF